MSDKPDATENKSDTSIVEEAAQIHEEVIEDALKTALGSPPTPQSEESSDDKESEEKSS
jgi:hypothetical protein